MPVSVGVFHPEAAACCVFTLGFLLLADCKASSALVLSWNNILQGEKAPPPRTIETRKTVKSQINKMFFGHDKIIQILKGVAAFIFLDFFFKKIFSLHSEVES